MSEPFATSLPSTLESIQVFEEMVRKFSRECGFGEDDQYFLALAAREIVTNAIEHGNRFDAAKRVEVRLACEGGQLKIEVCDEGPGFRLEDVPDPKAAENQGRRSGRGLAMAMGIMDAVSVEGSCVRMVKRIPHR